MPLEVSKEFGKRLIATIGLVGGLDLYNQSTWREVVEALRHQFHIREVSAFSRFYLGDACEFDLGRSNRITILAYLAEYGKLGIDVTLLCVGRWAHLIDSQVWHCFQSNPHSIESRRLLNRLMKPVPWPPRSSDLEYVAEKIEKFFHDNDPFAMSNMDGREFEAIVGEFLEISGLGIVEVTQPIKDKGVDLIVYIPQETCHDVLYVQCKAGKQRVAVRELRELIGVVARDGATAGLLVATAGFTVATEKEAALSRINIELVKAARLSSWIESKLLSIGTARQGNL